MTKAPLFSDAHLPQDGTLRRQELPCLSCPDFNEALLGMLSESPEIQSFIDDATSLLGNPLLMADSRFRILYSSQKIVLDIPLWNTSLSEHFISEEIINSMEKNFLIEQLRNGKGKTFLDSLPDGFHAIRVPLFYRGKCCGFLGSYDYARPFDDSDPARMLSLARGLTVLYNADPNILGALDDSRDSFLLELIKCESKEMAELLVRRNSSIRFAGEKALVCLTRRMQGAAAQSVAFGRLRDYLRQGIYSHTSTIYNHHLILLFSLQKTSAATRDSILNSIEECCARYDLYAGISYLFEEDSFIPLAYKQALKASLYGLSEEAARPHLCRYEKYMLTDIMNASLRVHPASFYEHPVLTRLSAYDKEYGTQYMATLRLYLDSFCNMKLTASEMGVHYNTIKYRISMIEEIGGREIRYDPELLLRLIMSIRIHDFYDEYREMRGGS